MQPGMRVDLKPEGLRLDQVDKGPFIQNMFKRREAWEVRSGFGQMAQFDTTLLQKGTGTRGYTKQLGSYALKTWWGATQIVTVLIGNGYTSNTEDRSHSINYYAVSIYDVDTNRRWEEILHQHTGEAGHDSVSEMPAWRGHYQTSVQVDRQVWVVADPDDDYAFFAPFNNDTLLFGNPNMGLWYYSPTDFDGTRWQQADGARPDFDCFPYSESSRVARLFPQPGSHTDSVAYFTTAFYPTAPVDTVMMNNRAYIAQGRVVFISDIGKPNSVIGDNIIDVPSDENITALGEVGGVLVIWTANETFVYRPNVGVVVSLGDLRRLSDDVGCLGPLAKTRMDESIVWCDNSGIYTFNGGLQMKPIGKPLQPLFESEESISLPLSSFYAKDGETSTVNDQPQSFIQWSRNGTVHMDFESDLGLLFIGLPESNAILVNSRGGWAVWSTESLASETADKVEARRGLPNPHIAVRDGRVFLIAGPELAVPEDTTVDNNSNSNSYIITEWGRGGGIDRSVTALEDMRAFNGFYSPTPTAAESFFFGEPVKLPFFFNLPENIELEDIYLVPVLVHPALGAIAPPTVDLRFTFRNDLWTPFFTTVAAEVAFMLPAERAKTLYAWGWGAPNATEEVRCYSGVIPDPTGNEIRIKFNGAKVLPAPQQWSTKPNLFLAPNRMNPLIWLPFKRVNDGSDSMSMGITTTLSTMNGIPHDYTAWQYGSVPNLIHTDNDVAQAVDWVLKTDRVATPDREQLRMRNVVMRLLTHGEKGIETVANDWLRGLVNVAFQGDWRDWSGQVIDMASYNAVHGKTPLRDRMVDTAGALTTRVFGTAGPQWGQTATSEGNFLVDDEEVNTKVMSASLRGESLSVMLFGHIRSRAEKVVVDKVDGFVRVVGAARRWGR